MRLDYGSGDFGVIRAARKSNTPESASLHVCTTFVGSRIHVSSSMSPKSAQAATNAMTSTRCNDP